jgi:hypothetical protein
MTPRSTILSLTALATLSLAALAPTQASAWGLRDGYGFGGYRSMRHFGPAFLPRRQVTASCAVEQAPTFRPSFGRPRFTEEFSGEGEGFESQGYASAMQPRGFSPMRQAEGYGSPRQMQGYGSSRPQFPVPESHGRRGFGGSHRGQDAVEGEAEAEPQAPQPSANQDSGPVQYSSKELQR